MSESTDEALTQELEALVAAKEREQRHMRSWFAAAFILLVAVILFRHEVLIALAIFASSIAAISLGVRHHLRTAKLRGKAMQKILTEAFRRAGQRSPEVNP